MNKENRKLPPNASRCRITEYALLTALIWLALFAGMAFLRFGNV